MAALQRVSPGGLVSVVFTLVIGLGGVCLCNNVFWVRFFHLFILAWQSLGVFTSFPSRMADVVEFLLSSAAGGLSA